MSSTELAQSSIQNNNLTTKKSHGGVSFWYNWENKQ